MSLKRLMRGQVRCEEAEIEICLREAIIYWILLASLAMLPCMQLTPADIRVGSTE